MTVSRGPAAIVVEEATKIIDGVTVLDGVSFTARPGRVTALLGPNGAGKTTTLRAILGIDHLSSGRARIGDAPFRHHPRPIELAGALLTPDAFHPGRTARGHLSVVAAGGGLPRMSVDWALQLVGMQGLADLPAGQMSLGMRQRLGLATAMIGDPAVLILDEPHNGLDTAAIRWLRGVLRMLADAGRTVLVSSHLMSEMEVMSDDVVVIDQGRIAAACPLPEFVGKTSLEEQYLDVVGAT